VAKQIRIRCAVYTRKSSEEGLEQAFNSLHAQREACEAYILSQRQEGWSAIDCGRSWHRTSLGLFSLIIREITGKKGPLDPLGPSPAGKWF
jgi:hypothetical protein